MAGLLSSESQKVVEEDETDLNFEHFDIRLPAIKKPLNKNLSSNKIPRLPTRVTSVYLLLSFFEMI